ncbi:cytochrome P460 family protein [Mesorhizobium sp. IMUNJ 23232]|uniref:cytochrome P460 family protein n=1 Tax=Mesorhizobium sp. IMUNJ 23232 TaxID=3376064 RepID=UPI00379BF499
MRTSSKLFAGCGILVVLGSLALAAQDKYTVQVPGGLALSECRGYDDWPAVAVSHADSAMGDESDPNEKINVIVANTVMIDAYRAGIPVNGKPFPDGSKIVKILWKPKQHPQAPFDVKVPDTLASVGCMVKDGSRFSETGGWGYAQFDFDPASDTFAPNTALQENDAKCGAACHQAAEATDFIFTAYGKR